MRLVLGWPGLALLPITAIGHHSVSATFDTGTVIEVEGEVTEVIWRNPHVHFELDATNESGQTESWSIELTSLSNLRRLEITPDFIEVGDRIRIAGSPARRTANNVYAHNILRPDGKEVLLAANVQPRWSSDTLAASSRALSTEGDGSRPDLGFYRVWSTPMRAPMLFPENVNPDFDIESYPLTQAARAAVEAFDPFTDSPTANCAPKGMPTIMEQPYPMEIVRREQTVELRLEEYDTVRTVYLDAAAAPAAAPVPRLGVSTGMLEGNTLTITTTGSDWPHFDVVGIPQSPSATHVEILTLSSDGSRLDYSITTTDSANFTEPVTLTKYWIWVPGVEVRPFECDVAQ